MKSYYKTKYKKRKKFIDLGLLVSSQACKDPVSHPFILTSEKLSNDSETHQRREATEQITAPQTRERRNHSFLE